MNEDTAFLQAIQDTPADETVRLVYADWLEERGDPRGEYLRLDTTLTRSPRRGTRYQAERERLIELRDSLDREWVITVSRSPRRCQAPACHSLSPVAARWLDNPGDQGPLLDGN